MSNEKHRARLVGGMLAAAWIATTLVADLLLNPTIVVIVLFAVGPLIASAVVPPSATAGIAAGSVSLTVVSASWNHAWGSVQQWVRVVDVAIIGAIAVGVSVVRERRERMYARAVAAEQEAGAQFGAAFEHAPVGMLLVDHDARIIRTNAAFTAFAGYRAESLVGMPMTALGDPRDLPWIRADIDQQIADGADAYGQERRLVTADGQIRWVSISVATVDGPSGAYVVAHVEDIHDRRAYEQRLRHLADHDALTGLFNRRRFHEELVRQVATHRRYGRTSMLLLIDLDGFKLINDTLGHATGDKLLQVIGIALRDRLRDSDVIGRLGGDEFGVLLPDATERDALAVADSLLDAVRSAEVTHQGQRVRSTASVGIAQLGTADADQALANADLALYAGKDSGRNTLVVYDPHGPRTRAARAQLRWLELIRHALDQDLFVLHAQPILDIRTGAISGAELLMRMRDRDQLIAPDQFLPVGERHGLAIAIDRNVIRHGITLAAAQRRPADFRWEINLGADSLGDPDIPDLIASTVAETGLAPQSLVFEITERAAVANMGQAQAFAERITDSGCEFALDDFGAGYGSFYWLKHLPAAYLKIDGEFIRQLTTSEVDRAIVEVIVAASGKLGKKTIAEYVADAPTLELLGSLHVDYAQGYHIGRPTALDEGWDHAIVPQQR